MEMIHFFCQAFYLSELKCLRYNTGKKNTSANLETIPFAMEYYGLIRLQSMPGRTDQQEAWIDRRINLLT